MKPSNFIELTRLLHEAVSRPNPAAARLAKIQADAAAAKEKEEKAKREAEGIASIGDIEASRQKSYGGRVLTPEEIENVKKEREAREQQEQRLTLHDKIKKDLARIGEKVRKREADKELERRSTAGVSLQTNDAPAIIHPDELKTPELRVAAFKAGQESRASVGLPDAPVPVHTPSPAETHIEELGKRHDTEDYHGPVHLLPRGVLRETALDLGHEGSIPHCTNCGKPAVHFRAPLSSMEGGPETAVGIGEDGKPKEFNKVSVTWEHPPRSVKGGELIPGGTAPPMLGEFTRKFHGAIHKRGTAKDVVRASVQKTQDNIRGSAPTIQQVTNAVSSDPLEQRVQAVKNEPGSSAAESNLSSLEKEHAAELEQQYRLEDPASHQELADETFRSMRRDQGFIQRESPVIRVRSLGAGAQFSCGEAGCNAAAGINVDKVLKSFTDIKAASSRRNNKLEVHELREPVKVEGGSTEHHPVYRVIKFVNGEKTKVHTSGETHPFEGASGEKHRVRLVPDGAVREVSVRTHQEHPIHEIFASVVHPVRIAREREKQGRPSVRGVTRSVLPALPPEARTRELARPVQASRPTRNVSRSTGPPQPARPAHLPTRREDDERTPTRTASSAPLSIADELPPAVEPKKQQEILRSVAANLRASSTDRK